MHSLVAEVAPIVPFAGAGGVGALGLLALLGTLLALGMQKAWKETLGTFLRHLAGWIDITVVHTHPFRGVSRLILGADQQVMNAFGALALKGEQASAWCFTQAGHMFWWSVHETASLAEDVLTRFEHLTTVTIPKATQDSVAALKKTVSTLTTTANTALSKAENATNAIKSGAVFTVHKVTMAQAISTHLPRAGSIYNLRDYVARLPQTIPRIAGRIGTIETWEKTAKKDIAGFKTKFATVAFTTLVIGALARLGLNWLRCPNVAKAGKSICKGAPHWLDELLGLVTDFFFLANVCQVIPWLEEGFSVVAAPMIEEFGKVGAGLCNASYKPAAKSTPPRLYLPSSSLTLSLPE